MQEFKVIIVLLLGLMITGCSVLDDFLQNEVDSPTSAAMSELPPTLAASQASNVQLGIPMASCWPDGAGTLCRDYLPSADWFQQGEFLFVAENESVELEFVEGRRPDGVTISVYGEFPPVSLLETDDFVTASNTVLWEASALAAGDYYVIVFGWWDNVETGARYDSVYVVPIRVD